MSESKIIILVVCAVIVQLTLLATCTHINYRIEKTGIENYRKGVNDTIDIMDPKAVEDL